MKWHRMTAELNAPLTIQQNRQSSDSQTLKYLPGSTLRGALAAKYLRETGAPDDSRFKSLFLEKPAAFPNLLPLGIDSSDSRAIPFSAVSCKRQKGFTSAKKHGVSDLLAEKTAARIDPATDIDKPCPRCGEDMKPLEGFWNHDVSRPRAAQPTMVARRRTGIDRDTGTISITNFFMTQAMADYFKDAGTGDFHPQWLTGSLRLSDTQLDALTPLLQGPVFAGGDRTRGYGELTISIDEEPRAPSVPDLPAWSDRFKAKLAALLQKESDIPSGLVFTLNLESDAILVDRFLRPTHTPHIAFEGVSLVMKIARGNPIRGWNAAWGLPKPDDSATAMGSVFLYQFTGDRVDELTAFLQNLMDSGIGLRTEEGFGRVSVCNPLHLLEDVI